VYAADGFQSLFQIFLKYHVSKSLILELAGQSLTIPSSLQMIHEKTLTIFFNAAFAAVTDGVQRFSFFFQ
jgi:hypothetical protein